MQPLVSVVRNIQIPDDPALYKVDRVSEIAHNRYFPITRRVGDEGKADRVEVMTEVVLVHPETGFEIALQYDNQNPIVDKYRVGALVRLVPQ